MGARSLMLVLGVALLRPGSAPAQGGATTPRGSSAPTSRVATTRVRPNDNRTPAGTLRAGVLILKLEARLGEWHPDGEAAPGVIVPAFAVEGATTQIPGPLIRVPQGAEVVVTVRNGLPNDTLRVHGLHERPLRTAPDSAPLVLLPGASRTVRFRLQATGTFYYWGTTTGRALAFRTGVDAQLTGAMVVDSALTRPGRDRIFVLGSWTDTVARAFLPRQRVLGVVNGRSWPATERLTARVGDSLQWRVINASGDLHPMHLHGFFFRVTARGDGTTDTLFTPDRAALAVTEGMSMGATYAMTWVPERAGNWLFHCHIPEHFGPRAALGLPPDSSPAAVHARHASHADGGMSGLVLGITVRARDDRAAAPARAPDEGRRRLRLLVRASPGSTPSRPIYRYAIHESGAEAPPADAPPSSPPLVLTRGEPVRIAVVNQLPEPTAVHWHGIELESYYDGVPGFSGAGRRITPAIAPGDSFEVRFTPPRAGTFIYHTHYDEDRQQAAGLAGALIVNEPGVAFDPATDRVVMITSPYDFAEAARVVLFNGAERPEPMTVRAGSATRLRIINMTTRRSGVRVRLFRGDSLAAWRLTAKDAAPVPGPLGALRAGPHLVSIGETLDLEIVPSDTTALRVEVRAGPQATAVRLGAQPIRVIGQMRPPPP